MNSMGSAKQFQATILIVAALIFAASLSAAAASPTASEVASVRSFSEQFIAYAARPGLQSPALLSLATNSDFVQLEPTLATVSCERIKQLLLRELDSTQPVTRGQPPGHIHIIHGVGRERAGPRERVEGEEPEVDGQHRDQEPKGPFQNPAPVSSKSTVMSFE